MSIVVVSAWPYCQGDEIAQEVAKKLNYRALGPELLERVAAGSKVSPGRLAGALGREAALLGPSPKESARLLAHLEAALLGELDEDKAVTWGLMAHLYLTGVSHVLKVRLMRAWEDRVADKAAGEGVSRSVAEKGLRRQDEARARLAAEVYHADESDPGLYDLTINLAQINPEQAVGLVVEAAAHKRFKPMTFSRQALRDKALAAEVRAALVDREPEAKVSAISGLIKVTIQAARRDQEKKLMAVRQAAASVPGVGAVEVEVIEDYFQAAADSMR